MPDFDIVSHCEAGHTSRMRFKGITRGYAEHFAQILDGTSLFYKYPPREFPGSIITLGPGIARCSWPEAEGSCGAWFTCTVEEVANGEVPRPD